MSEAPVRPGSVYLTAADPKRSIRFYEKLGFELSECWPDRRSPLRACLQLDGQTVMVGKPLPKKLAQSGASKDELRLHKKEIKAFKNHRHGVGVRIYIRVNDVDEHCKQTRRQRVELVTQPKTQSYGLHEYSISDPDGYRLVFYSPAPVPPIASPEPKRRRQASVELPSSIPVEELVTS